MRDRDVVARATFERVEHGDPEIHVFKISGSLGPRARSPLLRLMEECQKRQLPSIVLDLSEIDSLGARSARLLGEFYEARAAAGFKTAYRVTSPTVRGFLTVDTSIRANRLFESLDDAVAAVRQPAESSHDRSEATYENLFEDESEPEPERTPVAEPEMKEGPGVHAEPEVAVEIGPHLKDWSQVLLDQALGTHVHVFEKHSDDYYYLVARSGIDFERRFAAQGNFVEHVKRGSGAKLVIDVLETSLDPLEEELLAELNCEVVCPVSRAGVELIVFVAKEEPGDEYNLRELEALDHSLQDCLQRALEATQSILPASQADPVASTAASEDVEADTAVPAAEAVAPEEEIHAAIQEEEPDLEPGREVQFAYVPLSQDPTYRPVAEAVRAPEGTESDRERLLRRHVAQLRDILNSTKDFDATFGTYKVLEVLVLSVVSIAQVETVLFFSKRGNHYALTHHRGLNAETSGELRLRGESSIVQAALTAPRAVDILESPYVQEDERIWAKQVGVRYVMPLRFKTKTLGLVLLGSQDSTVEPDLEMLDYLFNQAVLAHDRARIHEVLEERTLGVVRGLISLIESRNGYDSGSTEQVVRYTQTIGREILFPEAKMRDLVYGAVLRDVGMLRISEALLRTEQELSADQWEAIRRHPIEGANIMRQMRFDDAAVEIVLHHHEAYNGEGYPMGLRGRAIPLGARIVSVAESYVKMTMDRPYRKALGRAEALESMSENWGLRYDPLVVDALVRVVNRELTMGLDGVTDLTRDLFGV